MQLSIRKSLDYEYVPEVAILEFEKGMVDWYMYSPESTKRVVPCFTDYMFTEEQLAVVNGWFPASRITCLRKNN